MYCHRCDDLPVVFSHLLDANQHPIQNIHEHASDEGSGGAEYLCYGGTETLAVPFQPHQLHMFPDSGRVYHPGPEELGGVGLIKSSLAIELSRYFVYTDRSGAEAPPTGFTWRKRQYNLGNVVLDCLNRMDR